VATLNYSPSGLPFGIQFISKKWNDYAILKFIDYLVDNKFLSPYVLKKK
jgi:Asp-tRNA(Asn)/Glu-tRNA(Gln) amidotransferase A subunit family amidase